MPYAQKDNLLHFPVEHAKVVETDQQKMQHHQDIEKHTAEALGEPVTPGSSIPVFETDPMKVLIPPKAVTQNTEEKIRDMTPKSYLRDEVPGTLAKIFSLFGKQAGKDVQETYDQHATGKSYRNTEASEFLDEMKKKKQLDNPAGELKKAA